MTAQIYDLAEERIKRLSKRVDKMQRMHDYAYGVLLQEACNGFAYRRMSVRAGPNSLTIFAAKVS
jgi:hypothetical protein